MLFSGVDCCLDFDISFYKTSWGLAELFNAEGIIPWYAETKWFYLYFANVT